MTNTITITADTFDQAIAGDTPVLVDFWAEWCGPCHIVAPTLDEIATEHMADLTVAKLNVDERPDIARDFGVMSIPTLILFKDGVEKKRLVGALSKRAIEEELAEFIP